MYRIADFNINIRYMYPQNKDFFGGYEIDGDLKEDLFVASTDREIEEEIKACLMLNPPQHHMPMYAERLVILRKLCALLIEHDTFLLHGATLEYEGEGYIFAAPTGTGKTTHAMLWRDAFGENNVRIINGDKPFIRLIDGVFYAYGTPWCGKENFSINSRVPVSAICFLERADINRVEPIDEEKALRLLMQQIDVVGSGNLEKLIELVGGFIEKHPAYKLYCNMDVSAATVAYNGIKQKKDA